MVALLQSVVVFLASGSVLLMTIVFARSFASFETRLRRIDNFLDRAESGTDNRSVS